MRFFTALTRAAALLTATTLAAGAHAVDVAPPASTAHAFEFTRLGGDENFTLGDYAGSPILVVNTASRCGFTPQYDGLQEIWEEYRDQGLVVIGVSSNSFNQELATAAEVKEFCEVNFSISFPLTDTVAVKGEDSHAFYDWVREQTGNNGFPAWNFNKVLLSDEGVLLDTWGQFTRPTSRKVRRAIEGALGETS